MPPVTVEYPVCASIGHGMGTGQLPCGQAALRVGMGHAPHSGPPSQSSISSSEALEPAKTSAGPESAVTGGAARLGVPPGRSATWPYPFATASRSARVVS